MKENCKKNIKHENHETGPKSIHHVPSSVVKYQAYDKKLNRRAEGRLVTIDSQNRCLMRQRQSAWFRHRTTYSRVEIPHGKIL